MNDEQAILSQLESRLAEFAHLARNAEGTGTLSQLLKPFIDLIFGSYPLNAALPRVLSTVARDEHSGETLASIVFHCMDVAARCHQWLSVEANESCIAQSAYLYTLDATSRITGDLIASYFLRYSSSTNSLIRCFVAALVSRLPSLNPIIVGRLYLMLSDSDPSCRFRALQTLSLHVQDKNFFARCLDEQFLQDIPPGLLADVEALRKYLEKVG